MEPQPKNPQQTENKVPQSNSSSPQKTAPTQGAPVKQTIRPEDSIVVAPLRTYEDDIKRAIESDNVSMIKIAMAEAKKQEQVAGMEEEVNPRSEKNIKIIAISFLLLVLGVGALGGGWYYFSSQKAVTPIVRREAIIPYDESTSIQLIHNERTEVITGMANASNKKYQDDTVLVFVPVLAQINATTTAELTTRQLFTLLDVRAGDALVRAFSTHPMLGLFRKDRVASPFLLLNTESFNQVYAGMLEWETAIPDDVGDIFFTKTELLDGATSSIAIADSLSFKDEVVDNRDVRALRTKSGRLLMYYSFINDRLVLLAKDFSAIGEVSKRLATVQFTQ